MKLHGRTPLKPSGRLDTSGIRRSVIFTEKKVKIYGKRCNILHRKCKFYRKKSVKFTEKSIINYFKKVCKIKKSEVYMGTNTLPYQSLYTFLFTF